MLLDKAKQSLGYVVGSSSLVWGIVGGNCGKRKRKQNNVVVSKPTHDVRNSNRLRIMCNMCVVCTWSLTCACTFTRLAAGTDSLSQALCFQGFFLGLLGVFCSS